MGRHSRAPKYIFKIDYREGPRNAKCNERRISFKRKADLIAQQIVFSYASDRKVTYGKCEAKSCIRQTIETPAAIGLA